MVNTQKQTLGSLATDRLRGLAEQYPWWGAVRMALRGRGEECPGSVLYAAKMRERTSPAAPLLKSIDAEELRRSATLNIIDDFLSEGEHRITIDEQTTDAPLPEVNWASEEEDEEFVSEELAEIYAKQHLFDLAIEIYQKLSLQDPKKSIYFAELIEELKKQQLENGQ